MKHNTDGWSEIKAYCMARVTEVAYKTWISRIEPIDINIEAGTADLLVPHDFYRQTIERCYTFLLDEAFLSRFGKKFIITIKIPDEVDKSDLPESYLKTVESKSESSSDFLNNDGSVVIDRNFTFENYIVGASNKFAHAASMAVASNPAGAYNPLFIYGNSGLGKTHLLFAIGNEIRNSYPNLKVQYVKGEDFTNELIECLTQGQAKMAQFRQKYRKADVLLMDDVHFIGGKEATQEEFFHTFNTLYESNKQIVLTSDRPPREIKTLEDRIRNRFEWGLLADVQPPDIETRMAIIKRKAEEIHFDIPNEICEYIASKLKTNVRQLEGVVKKLKAKSILAEEKVTVSIVNEAIKDIITDFDIPSPMTVEKIIDEVCRTFGVTSESLRSIKNKKADLAHARQIAIYIVREITHLPMTKIGEEFGGRHYSTIVYTIKQVEKEIERDPKTKATIEDIMKNIGGNMGIL